MYFEQFYLGCLAHASYMIGSEGEAAVVDPQRDVDIYVKAAEEHGLKIRHIFETHLHADFVSGHRELAPRTGAKIYIGEQAGATFPHIPVRDGFELRFGKAKISVLGTPGHTPESLCVLITDEEKSQQPWAVLTGDTLFLGDVGRPDLSKNHTPQQLAGMLYDSLHNKLMALPDDVMVYPAHGAGSLCGKNMRNDRSSTIGTERLTNYALQIPSREQFVQELTSNLPARPEYFLQDAEINRSGASPLGELPPPPPLSVNELVAWLEQDGVVLDVRPPEKFAEGHIGGSVNIALSGQFASWAGVVLGLTTPLVLVADSPEQVAEARMRLARVGIEDVRGYVAFKLSDFKPLFMLSQVTVQELNERRKAEPLQVLDVRRQSEWDAGHIADAHFWPLDQFKTELPTLDKAAPLAVHCKGGYRSMIACSLLQRAGYRNVINVIGGFDAWQKESLPVSSDVVVKA